MSEEREEVIAARMTMDEKEPIRIHYFEHRGDIEYVRVSFQGETKNLLLHYERFSREDCPYNQVPVNTPYIVIKNDVYELESFRSIGFESSGIG